MKPKHKHKRTQDTGVLFTDGTADGWVFDFPSIFCHNIDIVLLNYVDKFKTAKLRRTKGQEKINGKQRLTVFRKIWIRGVPPARSFEKGHIFYDPPGIRQMVWRDALNVLRRVVQVHEAEPDTRSGSEGWVSFVISYYKDGQVIATEKKHVRKATSRPSCEVASLQAHRTLYCRAPAFIYMKRNLPLSTGRRCFPNHNASLPPASACASY